MKRISIVAALALFAAGCGGAAKKEPIALDKVPENVLTAAKAKLPGVTFTRAEIKPNGNYEIRGADAKGKTREIDVTPDGKVIEFK